MDATAQSEGQLPGGLWEDGQIHRGFRFRPLTGRLEREISAALSRDPDAPAPSRISRVLSLALSSIGSLEPSPERVGSLCVSDRQYLLLRLASIFFGDRFWVVAHCVSCSKPFDLSVSRGSVPVKVAGPGFPFFELSLSGRTARFRVPCGNDQSRLLAQAPGADETASVRKLLAICRVQVPGEADLENGWEARLDPSEIEKLERGLEEVSPELGLKIQTQCPECGSSQQVQLEPFAWTELEESSLWEEVHLLALSYHWSESEILDLPSPRRKLYLGLIERSGGVASAAGADTWVS